MKPIGGYFELELNDYGSVYHDDAVALNSGRTALEFILESKKYTKLYIPYYTCDVILQPLKRLKIAYEFYHLGEDFIPKIDAIHDNEALLYVNYFGVMQGIVTTVLEKFKNVIIDNSQSFFTKALDNVPTFYSPRKFFGLPDGGFAYIDTAKEKIIPKSISLERMSHLLIRIEKGAEAGYIDCLKNNEQLNDISVEQMSSLTHKLLRNIDFNKTKEIRCENFKRIHKELGKDNKLSNVFDRQFDAPMVYPFLREGNQKLKSMLIENKIFIATYWPNVKEWLDGKNCFEAHLQDDLISIPIDQRYKSHDIDRIIKLIKLWLE